MFENFMQRFVRWLDPKLEKYRAKKPVVKPPKYTPKTLPEFIDVLKRTPKTILNDNDRSRIAAIMSFNDRNVKDLMVPKKQMIFVNCKDILGPLTLDRLYKSGFTNFPVVDNHNDVKGIIHTEALNTLEIKSTDRAEKFLDPHINYLHITDSLTFAASEIERTNSCFFLVLDESESLVGFFTIQSLLDYLLN